MCVAYISYAQYKECPLLIASNRDEYHKRPTKNAHFWLKEKNILAGKDLLSGGTWFALDKAGRWALITNYRDPSIKLSVSRSRGLIILDYFYSNLNAKNFVHTLQKNQASYYGYNILIGDLENLYYYSNISQTIQKLSAGCFAISNHLLDTPWPKLRSGKQDLEKLLKERAPPKKDDIFSLLGDREMAPENELPSTGIEKEWERTISARFIVNPDYGTRSSTLFYRDSQGLNNFVERTYTENGDLQGEKEFCFS